MNAFRFVVTILSGTYHRPNIHLLEYVVDNCIMQVRE